MSRFLQLHALTFYPPANLNRDDIGQPKTAVVGGVPRLRISSQALKRAWRKSSVFESKLDGHLGDRTRRLGDNIALALVRDHGLSQAEATSMARVFAALFGKPDSTPKPGQELFIKQLAFISPEEKRKLHRFLTRVLSDDELRSRVTQAAAEVSLDPENDEEDSEADEEGDIDSTRSKGRRKRPAKQSKKTTALLKEIRNEVLTTADTAADIAMFGRMLADSPDFNREAAVQVAHAFTTHRATVEDDFYTAVDDLKKPSEDAGAGFVGEQGFGSGVFYLYACVDLGLLCRNLGGDETLAGTACAALVEAMASVAPSGKQNSFAARARAEYMLAERGDAQPRTLAGAFARPVSETGLMDESIRNLGAYRTRIDAAYGLANKSMVMDIAAGEGDIAGLAAFCREVVSCPTS